VLWPLCAGRRSCAGNWPSPKTCNAPAASTAFAWVASPALLKRMGDNLDWPALSRCRVFSSGGALPADAAKACTTLATMADGNPRQLGNRRHRLAPGRSLWQPFADVELSQDADGALRIAYLPAGHVEHTADAARRRRWRFELLGRLDRIVKLEEKRISLPMLEQALMPTWVAEARLGVVRKTAPSSAPCWCSSDEGLHALRNRADAPDPPCAST
jgi:hypothetical protein